jgi:hypothetical protein
MKTELSTFITQKKESEKKTLIGIVLSILGALLFLGGMNLSSELQFLLIIGILIFFTGIIFIGIGASNFSKLNKRFKIDVLTNLLSEMVENGHYDPDKGLSQGEVYSTEFIKKADRFHTEDYLSGSIEGVHFISSDVKLEERHVEYTKDGTRTYYETYFLGRVFIFDFNKPFNGYIQVLETSRPTVRRGYKKIKLESVDFNKKFRTYSTDEHNAFYVLTPHLMEALMSFEKKNKGYVGFSFIDNKLHIGINNFRDTFELKMFRKLDGRVFDEFKRDLLVIKDVIQELKLNQNIFKKESIL